MSSLLSYIHVARVVAMLCMIIELGKLLRLRCKVCIKRNSFNHPFLSWKLCAILNPILSKH